MSLKFCPYCGAELDRDEDYCPYCGIDLRYRKSMEKEITPEPTVPSPPSEKEEKYDTEFAEALPRLIALIIDWFVVFIITIFTNLILSFIEIDYRVLILIILSIVSLLYFWIIEIITGGETLGKMAFNLRTVNAKTLEPAKPGNYLVNNLFKNPITFIIDLLIGVIVNIYIIKDSPKKRLRIMQNLSNTCVIRTY